MIPLLNADLSLYAKPVLLIAIFKDNFHITNNSIPEIIITKAAIDTWFQIIDLRLSKYYLSMMVILDYKNITL